MHRSLLMIVAALLTGCIPLFAQSNISSGEIKGMVTDPSNAIVKGVTVTATNTNTRISRSATTDERGEYRILLLSPGAYDLKAETAGFAAQEAHGVQVTVGQTATMDFRLQVGLAVETVTVTTETPLIETEKVQQSDTISETYIRSLPIDRRDYLTFSLLAPGVVDSNALADNSDFRVKQTPQSGLSFYGSNGRGNSVTVDGAEANDSAGGVRATLSQEAVQEFQINRSNYTAELGGASGGVINIISKSGGNEVHGKVFAYFRDQALDAADPFAVALVGNAPERVKPDANRQQYGGTITFPIKKERTFFFGAFEGLNRDESVSVPVLTDLSIFQPTSQQTSIINTLALNPSPVPIPCLVAVPQLSSLPPVICAGVLRAALTSKPSTVNLFKINSGVFPFTTNSKAFSLRFDHHPSDKHQLFLRYNYTYSNDSNQDTHALVGFSRATNVHVLDSDVVGGWTTLFSPKLVNEARFQWAYRDFFVTPNDPNGPELNITGYGFFGRDIFLPSYTIERRYEAADSLSYSHGTHLFKFGVNVLARGNYTDAHTFMGGRFGFGTLPGAFVSPALGSAPITALQAYDLGLPQSYQQGFGTGVVASTLPYYAFYAQDAWNVRPNLTLSYGLRYELDVRLSPVPTDKNNFAPRFGFSWAPGSNRKTVVRGGFGIFYSPIYYQIDHVVNSLNEINGYRQIAQVLTTLDPTNPLAPYGPINIFQTLSTQGVIGTRPIQASDLTQFGINVSQTGPRPPLTVLFRIDPNYRSPYSEQGSFAIEHEIAPGLEFSVNYIFAHTLKITRARDINLLPRPIGPLGIPDWSAASGCTGAAIYTCFRDPLLFQENLYESSARAIYHGMIVEVNKRFSRNFTLAANYTYSKAIDDVTDFNSDFQANDQTNLNAERALSAFDQRHKFVAYAYLQSPFHTTSGNSLAKNIVADFALTPILRGNSARPFNLLTGVDLNGDRHSTTDRPVHAGRNTGIGPDFWTFDLRLARQIRLGNESRILEVTAEAFNLLNRLNYASINNTVGPSFAAPFRVEGRSDVSPSTPLGFTSATDARRIQLGARFSF